MTQSALLDTQGHPISEEAIAAFQAAFRGEIVRPGDDGYDAVRSIHNAIIDKRPGLIAQCRTTSDVVAAVRFAGKHDILTAIRGGGHNVGGRALCDDGLVIDFSLMRGVAVDPDTRTVRAQPGARLGDVDRETSAFGLAVPCGTVSGTGIGGLTLGGGAGWLLRKYGMTIDNVLSFQVVTAAGQVVTASDTENSDLFWALRGGGGNFGIVTSFNYRAHPVTTVLGGLLIYPRSEAVDVLKNFRDFAQDSHDDLTVYGALLTGPDGAPITAVIPCYSGDDLSEGERLLKPLREFGSPLIDAVQPVPYTSMQTMLDDGFPDGNCNYWKSHLLRTLPDEALEITVAHANRMTSPNSAVVVASWGGAAGRVAPDATAYAHRDVLWDIEFLGVWSDPAESRQHIRWARDAAAATEKFATGGHLISLLDQEEDAVIVESFGSNYQRLSEIKKKWDPGNFFRVNQNIQPAD